jgi:ATP-dependent NAD(P)H-hydrate dehydratase
VTIVQKGSIDYITNGDEGIYYLLFVYVLLLKYLSVLQCDTEGGLKRMGGQGDILSGAIAAFLAWGKAYEENLWK